MSHEVKTQDVNRLLAALPAADYEQLAPHLTSVVLELGHVLFRPEEQLAHAYFPLNAIVSLLTELEDGRGMEVGLVGLEGVVGVSVFLGGRESKVATVQGTGTAWRISASALRAEFARGGELQRLLLRYTHALMMQISQSAVCNMAHNIDGRLARWLLMYHNRAGRDEFYLTHEFISHMLGVRRAGVSEVANRLQQRKLIKYQRGNFTILDREKLEEFACECYPVIKQRFERFLL